jgi:hypothetical protein
MAASRKNTTDAEVCRRWGITPHQLRVIRERPEDDAFKKGPGRPKRDPEVVTLEAELHRVNRGARRARHREHDVCCAQSRGRAMTRWARC